MVGRAVQRALTVVDLPFPLFHLGVSRAIESAGRVLKETRCQAVKLEGGRDQAEVIQGLVGAGIPVMAHVGLRPQNVHHMGGYRVQRDHKSLQADAQAAQEAGAFAIVLECIPAATARTITQALRIPTIGIGAGPHCDGQVLVLYDLVGMTNGYVPSFVRAYADVKETIRRSVGAWCKDVRDGNYPDAEHSFK
jgi:3-methyl-2-oxobutanoate hydroxymethyltransferase